jgi:hypothetical protein
MSFLLSMCKPKLAQSAVAVCLQLAWPTAKAQLLAAEQSTTIRLAARGSLVLTANKALTALSIVDAPDKAGAQRFTGDISLRADLAFAVDLDGKHLVGFRNADSNDGIELMLFDIGSGAIKRSIDKFPKDAAIDQVWTNSEGTLIGVFGKNRFTAYEASASGGSARVVFTQIAASLLTSPSGRLAFATSEAGRLTIYESRSWKALLESQSAVERGVQKWLAQKGMRPGDETNEGPFVFPVQPLQVSADDRLLTVSLGENANTFLNFCISTGELVSSIEFDKRVNVNPALSSDGRLFAVEVVPNSDDVAFQRPRSAYGMKIYESYSGKLLSSTPVSNSAWAAHKKAGSAYFMRDQGNWLGFLSDDRALLRSDVASNKLSVQSFPRMKSFSPAASIASQACSPFTQ